MWAAAVMWALCLLLAAAAVGLAPAYLLSEAPRLAQAGSVYRFSELSAGWSREILAGIHLVFLVGLVVCAMVPAARRLVARASGVSVALGLWEIVLSVVVLFLAREGRFAPPHMTVAALGALLVLGGIGLNIERMLEKLMSPKTPVVFIFGAAGLLGVVAFGLIGWANVRFYARVDYTRAGRYSLPEETRALLAQLDSPVKVTTLFRVGTLAEDTLRREVTDILDEYVRISGKIEVNHIDARRDTKATEELALRLKKKGVQLEWNAVFFECSQTGRVMKTSAFELLKAYEKPTSPQPVGREKTTPDRAREVQFRFLGDTVFHQVLSIVTTRDPITVYFVVGHGEKPNAVGPPNRMVPPNFRLEMEKAFSMQYLERDLRRRYFKIESLDLDELGEGAGIPEDCDVLALVGPWCAHIARYWERDLKPFSKQHAARVGEYLERGGRALVMVDPVGPQFGRQIAPLLTLLKGYGVEVDTQHIVIDERRVPRAVDRYGQVVWRTEPSWVFTTGFVADYEVTDADGEKRVELHPCVSALRSDAAVIEAAQVNSSEIPGLRHTDLLATSKNAWLQSRAARDGEPGAGDRTDRKRRVLGVAVEKAGTGEPVLVVVGCSNMFIPPMIRFDQAADNAAFGQKALAWLAGSRHRLGVRPKPTEAAYGKVDAGVIRNVQLVSAFIIPSVFVLAGVVVWLGRRK